MLNYLFKTSGKHRDFYFFSMFMDNPEDEKTKLISCLGAFRQFWGGLSQVSTAFLIHLADF